MFPTPCTPKEEKIRLLSKSGKVVVVIIIHVNVGE